MMNHDIQKKLNLVVITSPSDFEPFGERSRESDYGPDCSCGCKHFLKLSGDNSLDWGVCINHHSPRRGLLTHEHMGCKFFEELNDFSD